MNEKMKKRLIVALFFALTVNHYSYSEESKPKPVQGVSFEEIKDEIKVYPGRFSVNNGTGSVYSITDIGTYQLKLDLIAHDKVKFDAEENLMLEFYPVTNYSNFITRWELAVYDVRDTKKLDPLKVIKRDGGLDSSEPIEVELEKGVINSLNPVTDLYYILKVYDGNDRLDETYPRTITIVRDEIGSLNLDLDREVEKENALKEMIANAHDNRRLKNIVLLGANVKIIGDGLEGISKVSIDGKEREVDLEETFAFDTHLGKGVTIIPVELISKNGLKETFNVEIYVPERYDFLVGIADFTIGRNKVTGNQDVLNPNNSYREDLFKTGRLAFYYKGLVDKYRITAHADTYERDIENMFKDFSDRDPGYYYRKLEYDPIEFNYGDDSVLYSDVDTQGKMYLRVDWEKNTALWGNFNTGFTGNKYSSYNRTMYGAKGEFSSLENNIFGDSKYYLSLFGSKPDSVYAHDELLGTGGSFYYLSYRDIVVGSAKISVQVKDPTTGRVLGIVELQEGQDYTINETQGLIRMVKPLSIILPERMANEIIKDQPLSGYLNFLVVDYEYYSRGLDPDSTLAGVRAKTWLTDHIGIGGTAIDTSAGEHQYTLGAADVTLKKSEGTYLRGEYAQSKGDAVYEDSISINGGLDFFDREVGYVNNREGSAYIIEGSLSLRDFSENFSSRDGFTFWYDKKKKGFSSTGERATLERENYGGDFGYQATEKLYLNVAHEYFQGFDSDSGSESRETSATAEYLVNEKIAITGELLTTRGKGLSSNDSGIDVSGDNGSATLAGIKTEYRIDSNKRVYLKGQGTLERSGGYETNNMISLGGYTNVTERLNLEGEVSTGTRGNGSEIGANYSLSDKHDLYSKYTLQNEGSRNNGIFTFGQGALVGDRTRVYQENQFINSYEGKGFTGGYGVDYQQNENLWLGGLYQSGELDIDGGKIKKDSLTLQSKFEKKDFTMRNTLEYSKNRGTGNNNTDSWGTANRFRKILNEEYTVFGVANFLDAKNVNSGERQARNTEFGVGGAYRPIWNDKVNFIGKYSYIYDLGSLGQINTNFGEQAHVLSLNTVYEINEKWETAFKYAYRQEKVRVDRNSGPWFSSNLDLFAVRLSYEVIHKWDIFGEYHWLRNITDDQIKHGAVVGVYRELHKNLQLGVGYNFTEFDDDLTRLDYKSKGWFINLIGKF